MATYISNIIIYPIFYISRVLLVVSIMICIIMTMDYQNLKAACGYYGQSSGYHNYQGRVCIERSSSNSENYRHRAYSYGWQRHGSVWVEVAASSYENNENGMCSWAMRKTSRKGNFTSSTQVTSYHNSSSCSGNQVNGYHEYIGIGSHKFGSIFQSSFVKT